MPPQIIDAVFNVSQSHIGLSWFSPAKRSVLLETCMWCLAESAHTSGAQLQVYIGQEIKVLHITWKCTPEELERIGQSHPLDNLVEFGAEAVSLVAIYEFTPYKAIGRSAKKTGMDYRLSTNKDPAVLFAKDDARLEVSGILRETEYNSARKRVGEKRRQSMQSDDSRLPVYVIVVEFSTPKAYVELRHV